jgi:hypothetical protein
MIIKKDPTPMARNTTIKYRAPKIINILKARFVLKEAARKKDFHWRLKKCLNIWVGQNYMQN